MNSALTLSGNRRLIDEAKPAGGARPPRISIKDGRFTLFVPGGSTLDGSFDNKGAFIDIVIVDVNPKRSKLFWGPGPRVYDAANVKPPLCWSDNGIAPSSGAAEPQSPTCSTCPHDVWGSAINALGNKVKACEDFKKMAVLVKGTPGIYLFELKPGSFKNWDAYTGTLSMHKLPHGGRPDLYHVVTRVRFAGTGVLAFEPIEWVENTPMEQEVLRAWETNKESDVSGLMIGRYDQPAQGVIPIAQQKEAEARGMPAQAPIPPPPPKAPPPTQPPFVLSGANPAGPLFPQQPVLPQQPVPQLDEEATRKRGRPKKVEAAPQTQPVPPTPPLAMPASPQQGIQSPADGLPSGISDRLRSLFPKSAT